MSSTPPEPIRLRPWLLAWVLATLVFSALHFAAWNPPVYHGSAATLPSEGALKLADNFFQLMILPAWGFVWRVLGRFQDIQTTLLANALGWALWSIAAFSAARMLRRLRGRVSTPSAGPAVRSPLNESRRRFLTGGVVGAACGVPASVAVTSVLVNPWRLTVPRYRVPIAGLPASLDGLRLVQLSDTHLGPRIPREHIRRAVELAISLRPDLVLLTGDYIHMGTWYVQPAADLFEPLTRPGASRLGVAAVLGNHDHYGDPKLTVRALSRLGIRVLNNDRCFIDASAQALSGDPPGSGLCIAGVDDLLESVVDHEAALAGVPSDMPRIMLAHNPDTSELLAGFPIAPRVDLMISGHTHGGQIAIPGIGPPIVPSKYGKRFARGLVETSLGPMIVSAGVGMSIMPLRVNVPPEVVEITLTRNA